MDLKQVYSDFVQKAKRDNNHDIAMYLLGLSGAISKLTNAVGMNNLGSTKIENKADAGYAMQQIFEYLFLLCSKIDLDIEEIVAKIGDERGA